MAQVLTIYQFSYQNSIPLGFYARFTLSTGKNKQSDWQKHKYDSPDYYKHMCGQYQEIIQNRNERGLDEIPGLLTVKTVKPKELEKTKNIRITNVHGSMEAKDILSKVEEIEKEKQKEDQLRD